MLSKFWESSPSASHWPMWLFAASVVFSLSCGNRGLWAQEVKSPSAILPETEAAPADAPPLAEKEQPDEQKKKAPLPDDAAQEKARTLVKEIYWEELSKAKTPAERESLAKRLLQQSDETKTDLAGKYVLLQKANEMAVQAGDVTLSFRIIDTIARLFQIDSLALKLETLPSLAKTVQTPAAHRAVAEKALDVIDEAMGESNFDAARSLGKLAVAEASKTRDNQVSQEVRNYVKDLERTIIVRVEFDAAMSHLGGQPERCQLQYYSRKLRLPHKR